MQFRNLAFGKAAAVLALGMAALGATSAAHANGVFWSVGVNAAPGVAVGVSNARPVYVQPAPVYVQPQPVYVQPQPVYMQPQVVYSQPQVIYPGGGYVQAAPVYVRPYPVYRTGWVPPGHRFEHDRGHGHGHR